MVLYYEDIFTQCEQMSAFEGQRAISDSGESLYSSVHLTPQDKPWVYEAAAQALDMVGRALRHVLSDTAADASSFTFTWTDDAALRLPQTLLADIERIAAAAVMQSWMALRLPNRAEAWAAISSSALQSLQRIINKPKPALSGWA